MAGPVAIEQVQLRHRVGLHAALMAWRKRLHTQCLLHRRGLRLGHRIGKSLELSQGSASKPSGQRHVARKKPLAQLREEVLSNVLSMGAKGDEFTICAPHLHLGEGHSTTNA
eukprot:CAMPEP_0171072070 /NCGR_PEP_ID=MMETSP0766_2-20121228/10652_1 /TAXON_ID=439317 /ORGANISM="Gambierdiscus australes, Strain CAWD 149" /LENGTH=111 /DNA_ID=CAMNT_0011528631 /DNA_START=317 /DNA_END=652 /DNA_ORIENTATION=+